MGRPRITECSFTERLGLEGTSVGHLVQPPCYLCSLGEAGKVAADRQ